MRTCVKFTFANKIEAMHEIFARKGKAWTSLDFSFKLSTFYLAPILFTWLKFTCVTKNASEEINLYRVFLHDVTAAILVSQTGPVGDELFSYANAFFCSNKFAKMLATWVNYHVLRTWSTCVRRAADEAHTNSFPFDTCCLPVVWRLFKTFSIHRYLTTGQ